MNKNTIQEKVKCTWEEPEFNDKLQASVFWGYGKCLVFIKGWFIRGYLQQDCVCNYISYTVNVISFYVKLM